MAETSNSFIANVNALATKLDIIIESNEIFDEDTVPILREIANLDLKDAIQDLRKGNYLGNRKIDINLALNMQGITQELINKRPDEAELIWTDPSKTVRYDSAKITFVDGVIVDLPFMFDGNPTTISTHGDLLIQLNRFNTILPVKQVDVINNILVTNNTDYEVTVNGQPFVYTSDDSANLTEIITGLAQVINAGNQTVAANVQIGYLALTAKVAGELFTSEVSPNMLLTPTVLNVPATIEENAFLAKLINTDMSGFSADVVGEFVRLFDIVGSNSNIERIQLKAVAGNYIEENPLYYWANTTSSFQTLAMRTGDIVKLSNDIDSIILLANRIEQVLEIQSRIPLLVDRFIEGVPQGDLTVYNKLAELMEIYEELSVLITVYEDIKPNGTNFVNKVGSDIGNTDFIKTVAEDLNLGINSATRLTGENIDSVIEVAEDVKIGGPNNIKSVGIDLNTNNYIGTIAQDLNLDINSKINIVGENINNVVTVANNITSVNTTSENILDVSTVATNIVPNLDTILSVNAKATIAVNAATSASASALTATNKSNEIKNVAVGSTVTGASGVAASVVYNPADGKFSFVIPQGSKGEKGEAFQVNSVGLLSDKSLYDGQNRGFSFLAIDTTSIYFKMSNTSGDWSVGSPFGKGEKGDVGDTGNGIITTIFTSTTDVSGLQGQNGATDTYTISYTNGSSSTFLVYNGINLTSSEIKTMYESEPNKELTSVDFISLTGGGKFSWNSIEKTVDVELEDDVTLQLGQEMHVNVYANKNILNGQVVMAVGTIVDTGKIKVEQHTGTKATGVRILGVATHDMAIGSTGLVTSFGKVRGIDATGSAVGETWVDGDVLYIKPNDSGKLTKVEPIAGQLKMRVGYVINAHATKGAIFIRISGIDEDTVKADVGLSNVDNTTDLNKPVSTATQTALNLKANLASPTFTGTVNGISKSMVGLGNVDNTTDLAKPISTAQQTALNLKANLASPTFTGTVLGITKAMVGLNSVENTADSAKPISIATQTALNLKANLASPAFTGTVTGLSKAMVGLSNVDNTTDAAKPISTTTQTALNLKADKTQVLTNVPAGAIFTDNNTTYTAGTGLSLSGTVFTNSAPNVVQTTVTGNAGSATKLATARTINGVAFNGSANITVYDSTKAPLASPALTGVPTAPTAAVATNNTQIATTAFVKSVVAGSGTVGYTQSFSTNGWTKLPNGLIIQWGTTSALAQDTPGVKINFPIAFPNACFSVTATFTSYRLDGSGTQGVSSISRDSFIIFNGSDIAGGFRWMAIGY